MPLPNGVHRAGRIEVVCPSAMPMGNRGILHRQIHGPVSKDWQHESWVACRLNFGGWQRGERIQGKLRLMASLKDHSELFFLDEVTALSAGHRPCGTCRRFDYAVFKSAWCKPKAIEEGDSDPKLVDHELHQDRCASRHDFKQTSLVQFDELPDGAMFLRYGRPYLCWRGKTWLWSVRGHSQTEIKIAAKSLAEVLTPNAILAALRAGYCAQVHQSAAFA